MTAHYNKNMAPKKKKKESTSYIIATVIKKTHKKLSVIIFENVIRATLQPVHRI